MIHFCERIQTTSSDVSHVNNNWVLTLHHYTCFFFAVALYSLTSLRATKKDSCTNHGSDHWRESSRNDSMSMKSHFDCRSEQWHAPSQSWINRRTHFKFVKNDEENISNNRPFFINNIFNTFSSVSLHVMRYEKCYSIRHGVLPTTKGKTGRRIDTWRLPDISAEKCCNGGGQADGGRRKEQQGRHAGRVNGRRSAVRPPRARKVNVFPAVNTRRTERRPGVGRLVTWSTVNDRESASRMRRYAADPDARNVIAARPLPSILGDPRGPFAVAPRLTHIAVTTGWRQCRHLPRGHRYTRVRSFLCFVSHDLLLRRLLLFFSTTR